MPQVHLHSIIADLLAVQVHFYFSGGEHVSKACELMEMPAECVSGVIQGLIACADEAAALDEIVSFVESGSGEVFIDWMDLEVGEGVDGSDSVLPDVADDIVEVASFEEIDWIGRHPVLHVDVAHRLVLPGRLVGIEHSSNRVVLVLSWQSHVGAHFD